MKELIVAYKYLTQLFKDGIKIAGDDGDDVTVDLYTTALGDIEKTLWMIEAEVG